MPSEKRENFSNRKAAIFTLAGSAIGLGNIWRFPYMVGEHGGAAFVVLYIVATLLISLPVFIAEITLGRRARTSAYGSMSKMDPSRKFWKAAGILSIIIPLIIISYYSIIGGWSLEFLFKACTAEFIRSEPDTVNAVFGDFISNPVLPVLVHLAFLAACTYIVAHGIKSGIERFSKLTIPVLFVLIVLMAVYSITLPGASAGVRYLARPDFSQINARSFAYALGQSFYSLSLGMGAIVTYGSYIHKDENLLVTSGGTAISDLLFALLASFAIMPAVFAAGIEPGAGPGLVFQSIPFIFSSLGSSLPVTSTVASIIFFVTLLVAAMTSCISLLEVGVSFLTENKGMERKKACLLLFAVCGTAGAFCSLSFGPLSSAKIGNMGIFDIFDWLSSNILLPILAFITVIFVGFVMKKDDVRDEMTNAGSLPDNVKLFSVVFFLLKWLAPVAIVLIFITNFIL